MKVKNMLMKAASLRLNPSEITQTEECCICYDNFTQEQDIIRLPCNNNHIFHAHCIGEWMERNTTCPLCKIDISNNFDKDGNTINFAQNMNDNRPENSNDIEMGDTEITEDEIEQRSLVEN